MTLRGLLERIMNEYPSLRGTPLSKQPPLFSAITKDLPSLLRPASRTHPHFIWEASVGKGQWADAPWLAVFDPIVTDSARFGYYPVYLFSNTLESVYLSMNQGMTHLHQEYGVPTAREILRQRATLIRMRLRGQYEYLFPLTTINLQHPKPGSRLSSYEPGHAFGCCYARGAIPPDDILLAHAEAMVDLYATLTKQGGVTDLKRDIDEEDTRIEEARKYTYHRTIERSRKLALEAKRIHGHVCQACGFDFTTKYGDLGRGYIEAHHRVPLWQLVDAGEPIRLDPRKDFAVVCANCHRMLHRPGAPANFEDFVAAVRRHRLSSDPS